MTDYVGVYKVENSWTGICVTVFLIGVLLVLRTYADEPQKPIGVAGDVALLTERVERLEGRVEALEAGAEKSRATEAAADFTEELPVLEVQTESWCASCKVLEADILANGQEGKTWVLKRVNLRSGSIPAVRFKGKDGNPKVSVGYTRGRLQQWLGEMGVR